MFSTCRFLMVFIIGLFLAAWLPGCDDDNGNASNQGPALTREPIPAKIPDTGQTASFTTTFGEDADYAIHPQSYTKLDNNGASLPDNAADWAMVQDNVTGLIWEVKTDDSSIHDKDNTYEWLYARNEYTKELNEQAFGGYADWRLPYVRELSYLVHLGDPLDPQQGILPPIHTAYFPNTSRDFTGFWTYDMYFKIFTSRWYVNFFYGKVAFANQEKRKYVRALRGDAAWEYDDYADNGDGTVTDRYTGLIWQIETAAEEMTWEGALDYCEHLSLAGYTDCRLPNRNELQSLVDKQPAEDHDLSIPTVFQNTTPEGGGAAVYWTSSSDAWPPMTGHGL